MRFRSIGTSASNIEEYLKKIKEKENNYIEESTLSHITFISLKEEEKIDYNNDIEFLGPKSNYKIKKLQKNKETKKGNKNSTYYFRKKIFFHHKRKRINQK